MNNSNDDGGGGDVDGDDKVREERFHLQLYMSCRITYYVH